MPTVRKIRKVWRSKPTIEGAGVHLKRAFGYDQVPQLDPFLLLDDFHSSNPAEYLPGFPWHPHRGIETITYVLQGDVEHGDSMGNRGDISPGDVQWMTAGSGIIHQEMPKGDADRRMWGFQLWANLPASHKMMDPRYRDVTSGQIPKVDLGKALRQRSSAAGRRCPGAGEDIVTDLEYLDITVPANTVFTAPRSEDTVFAYVVGDRRFSTWSGTPSRAAGRNWYDMERKCLCGEETRPVRRRGRSDRRHGRPAGPLPSRFGEADRRAGRLVRTDRHEYPGGASDRLPGVRRRDFHQGPVK
jgi:redox-sensitive bicupin YhaK (pirin superfamily)